LKDTEMNNAFFKKNIIIHTHVEKAAGTSLVDGFVDLFGKSHLHDFRGNLKYPLITRNIYVLSGHFHYRQWLPYVQNNMWLNFSAIARKRRIYIGSFRDPVERFVSFFYYVKNGLPSHPAYPDIDGRSLDEAFEFLVSKNHLKTRNSQCCIVSGKVNATFNDAVCSLEENYGLYIPCYLVNDALNFMADVYGIPLQFAMGRKRNAGSYTNAKLSPGNQELFYSRAEEDLKLYHYIEEKYQECKGRFKDYVRSFY